MNTISYRITLFLMIGIPLWLMTADHDTLAMLLLWVLLSTAVMMYFLVRTMEKTGKYGDYSRGGIGSALMAKSGAVFIASVIAWNHWPIQASFSGLITLLIFIEARRLVNGWKLFFPVKKID